MRESSFVLEVAGGRRVAGVLHEANRPGPRPTVLVCHGFKGFMDWGFFPSLARLLADRGFTAVRFNFSGSGMRPGEDRASDLEGFRRNTFSRERDETLELLGSLGREIGEGLVDRDRLGLFGHSRGGGAALLAAAAAMEQVGALVTWAGVGTFQRFDAAVRDRWRREGVLVVLNGRTGQEMPLGLELLDDLESNAEALDLERAASRRLAPWLVVHGDGDETVPVREARRLVAAAAPPTELLEIAGGGHTFGAVHPFAGPTPHLVTALNASQSWFRRWLVAREPPGDGV